MALRRGGRSVSAHRRLGRLAWVALLFLAACGEQAEEKENLLEHGKKLYSAGKEELIIRDFFKDRRDGYFVDVGCYHWSRHSTTFYLEKHLGWSGIGIDAQERFREGYVTHRPRTKF